MKTTYAIEGMHCQSCVSKLTASLSGLDGVSSVDVSLAPPQAELESELSLDDSAVRDAVSTAGDYHVVDGTPASPTEQTTDESFKLLRYYPLLLIVAFIIGGCGILQWRAGSWGGKEFMPEFMADFMGGFFVVFSFFKLLNPRGFADAYSTYDVIAAKSRQYALAYPFIELGLGLAYLLQFQPMWTNVVTLVLMLVGSIGVIRSLMNKQRIQCACLGTVFDLPMSTVTVVEDLGMAAMAAAMLVWGV